MPLETVPTDNFQSAPWGAWKAGINKMRDVVAQIPGGGAPPVTRTISAGKITVDAGDILLETEGGASSDDLVAINLAGVPQYRAFRLRIANNARQVVIQHMFNSGSGSGEIILTTGDEVGDNIVLDSTKRSITMELRGTQVFEVRRDGFTSGGAGGFDGNLSSPLIGNLNRATGILFNEKDITAVEAPGGNYTLKMADVGDWLNFYLDCTVVLPNPNAVDPATGKQWLAGMIFYCQRHAALLRGRTHTGATPSNPLGHDRAMGDIPGAVIQFKICKAVNGTLFWRLMGETTGSATTGGGGGTPVPTTLNRTYSYSPVHPILSTAATVYTSAGTHNHTPEANSKYFYFVDLTFDSTGTNVNNTSDARVVNTAVPATALAALGRPRQASQRSRTVLGWGANYGASPAAQTFRCEAKNGAAGFNLDIEGLQFVALKLEAEEEFGLQVGAVSPGSGAWASAAAVSYTASADEYVAICGMAIETSGDHRYQAKLTVNGVDVVPASSYSRANPSKGYYFTFKRFNHAGGTLSASVQINNVSGTTSAENGWIVVLKSDRFQSFDYAESPAETALMNSSTSLVKLAKAATLQANWRSLVFATCQGYMDIDDTGDGCSIHVNRNGSLLGPEAELGIRLQSGQPAHYAPASFGMATIVTPGAAEQYDMRYYSEQGATANVKVRDAAMLFLSLGPIA